MKQPMKSLFKIKQEQKDTNKTMKNITVYKTPRSEFTYYFVDADTGIATRVYNAWCLVRYINGNEYYRPDNVTYDVDVPTKAYEIPFMMVPKRVINSFLYYISVKDPRRKNRNAMLRANYIIK